LSFLYFIRHAQAGSRDNYDVLSPMGQEQARLLGKHFVEQEIELSAVITGGMQRQQHTAEIVRDALVGSGKCAPDVTTDERWNEFSLLSVYRAIAHRMIEESAEFASDYKEMQEALRRDPHTVGGATGRCDFAVVSAWMTNRYPDYEGETWSAFRSRIQSCACELPGNRQEKSIAVFTSATPIAIVAGVALGLTDEKLLSILGVLYNTGITVLRARGEELRMLTLNSTPHLPQQMRTFR